MEWPVFSDVIKVMKDQGIMDFDDIKMETGMEGYPLSIVLEEMRRRKLVDSFWDGFALTRKGNSYEVQLSPIEAETLQGLSPEELDRIEEDLEDKPLGENFKWHPGWELKYSEDEEFRNLGRGRKDLMGFVKKIAVDTPEGPKWQKLVAIKKSGDSPDRTIAHEAGHTQTMDEVRKQEGNKLYSFLLSEASAWAWVEDRGAKNKAKIDSLLSNANVAYHRHLYGDLKEIIETMENVWKEVGYPLTEREIYGIERYLDNLMYKDWR